MIHSDKSLTQTHCVIWLIWFCSIFLQLPPSSPWVKNRWVMLAVAVQNFAESQRADRRRCSLSRLYKKGGILVSTASGKDYCSISSLKNLKSSSSSCWILVSFLPCLGLQHIQQLQHYNQSGATDSCDINVANKVKWSFVSVSPTLISLPLLLLSLTLMENVMSFF